MIEHLFIKQGQKVGLHPTYQPKKAMAMDYVLVFRKKPSHPAGRKTEGEENYRKDS